MTFMIVASPCAVVRPEAWSGASLAGNHDLAGGCPAAVQVNHLGPHLWDRETRFHYRSQEHHRREAVYLARITDTTPTLRPTHTANEKPCRPARTSAWSPSRRFRQVLARSHRH
jgi:hypothetical protein